jgi:serine protease
MTKKKTRARRSGVRKASERTGKKKRIVVRSRTTNVRRGAKGSARKGRVKKRTPAVKKSKSTSRASAERALIEAARSAQGRRIVVLFRNTIKVPHTRGFKGKPGNWAWVQELGVEDIVPIFDDVRLARRLEARSKEVRREDWESYSNAFFLILEPSANTREVLEALRTLSKELRWAYEDREPVLACPAPTENDCLDRSGHLDPSPKGVDSAAAWKIDGGQGELQCCVDVERGWTTHERIAHPLRVKHLCGRVQFGGIAHGTQVLGILCGSRSMEGCQGIVPELAEIYLASHVPPSSVAASVPLIPQNDPNTPEPDNLYAAVGHAIDLLGAKAVPLAGSTRGVVLIEYHTPDDGLPMEILPLMQELIMTARDHDVAVVEAAGNWEPPPASEAVPQPPPPWGRDLDLEKDLIDGTTFPLLRPEGADDSGAIMVGSAHAAVSNGKHDRFDTSNFGSRLDCYAWGEGIRAPTFVPSDSSTPVNQCEDFGQTSGAAAIIAGVALQLLGVAASHGVALDPPTLRSLLCDPLLGTPSTDARIRTMPDLARILAEFATRFGVSLRPAPVS